MLQVTAYKVDSLVGVKPNAIVALKVPNENKFELFVTSRSGVPFPLNVSNTFDGITDIVNTDNNLSISGSSTITINISNTLLATINSALQAGDNISNLLNDVGYLVSADLPTKTSDLLNDGADTTSTYVEADELGTTAFSNDYNDLDNKPSITGVTNLSYTPSATNGIISSDTGNDATIPLADTTNAGLLKPSKYTVLENTSGTNTGDQDLSSLAPKASPTLTGVPTAPTAASGTNTTQIATTAFVNNNFVTLNTSQTINGNKTFVGLYNPSFTVQLADAGSKIFKAIRSQIQVTATLENYSSPNPLADGIYVTKTSNTVGNIFIVGVDYTTMGYNLSNENTARHRFGVGSPDINNPASTEKFSIGKYDVLAKVPLTVEGKIKATSSIQIGNDTDTASATNVGSTRYRTSGNNSYVDMCMQTGASTYEWVNIKENNW